MVAQNIENESIFVNFTPLTIFPSTCLGNIFSCVPTTFLGKFAQTDDLKNTNVHSWTVYSSRVFKDTPVSLTSEQRLTENIV